jgi:lipopolysaccharide export system permease protein
VSRFDRYFLWQLLLLFAFFSLILVGVLWITRSVSLLDKLIADGQSAIVFLEFTALTLPSLIQTVMPIGVFAAGLYVTNRLNRESELIAMLATGASPWRLARAVILFGLLTGAMMAILANVLRPASIAQLEQREAELSQDVTAGLLEEGNFLHPVSGVTLYIRDIGQDGVLNDVFLSDRRDPARSVTYICAQAFLVRDNGSSSLIMVDGMALRRDAETDTLSSTLFRDFSFDISSLLSKSRERRRSIRAISSWELFTERPQIIADENYTEGELLVELHERIAWSTICLAVGLIGFATLMLGGFSRFGLWPQLLVAFFLLIVMEGMRGALAPIVVETAHLWPVLYLPTLLGLVLSVAFLRIAGRPVRVALGLARRPAS